MIFVKLSSEVSAPIEYGHLDEIAKNGFISCSNITCDDESINCTDFDCSSCFFRDRDYKAKIELKILEEEN